MKLAAIISATALVLAIVSVGIVYDLGWSTTESGGVTLSGGGYELTATAGQPDTAKLSAGGYELTGGLWQAPQQQTSAPNAPTAAPAPHDVRKHRYVSIDASGNGQTTIALKVTLAAMSRCAGNLERACSDDNDCDGGAAGPCTQHLDVGSTWWVQQPQDEPLGCLPGPCGPTDQFARVESRTGDLPGPPDFRVWTDTTLHVGDCEIIPVATYEIRACLPPNGAVCSNPLTIGTINQPFIAPGFRGNYGDVAGPVVGTEFTPPDGIGNIGDVSAYVLTSQNYGTANTPQTHPTWVDLNGLGTGSPPQYILNVSDLGQILKALQGNKWTDDPGNLNPASCP